MGESCVSKKLGMYLAIIAVGFVLLPQTTKLDLDSPKRIVIVESSAAHISVVIEGSDVQLAAGGGDVELDRSLAVVGPNRVEAA